MAEHIHTPDDGRGIRDVYVDGKRIEGVMFADTLKGIVVYAPRPYRVDPVKRDQVYTQELRGKVEVIARG